MVRAGMLAFALLISVAICGCCRTAMPSWSHPGTADAQRCRALRYDPYPENEPGPAVVGVRPREFDQPPPEPSRARWQDGNWGQ